MRPKIGIRLLCLVLCLAVLLPSAAALGETTKVAAYLLRLREKPSTSAKVLDAYPRGTTVTILKKGTEWTKVQVRGKTGYMQTVLLAYGRKQAASEKTASSAGKQTAKAVATGETAYIVSGIWLNLRTSINGGDIIESFRGGTEVTIIKKGRHWSLVEVKGYQGYMCNDYLTSEKP
ncbi:MAG: SH3 domain-containing protein [Clostridia bacterium]|nr:SH3 domain-containing protein [Clostridia bacterium]